MDLSQPPASALLAHLLSQHEQLRQLSADVSRAFATSKVALEQVHSARALSKQRPFSGLDLDPLPTLAVTAADTTQPPGEKVASSQHQHQHQHPHQHDCRPRTPDAAEREWSPAVSGSWPEGGFKARVTVFSEAASLSQLEGVMSGEHRSASQIIRDSACASRFSRQTSSFREEPSSDLDSRGLAVWQEVPDDVDHMSRHNAIFRLKARLGNRTMVSTKSVHNCLVALGLTKYTYTEIEEWLQDLEHVSNLDRVVSQESSRSSRRSFAFLWRTRPAMHPENPRNSRGSIHIQRFAETLLSDDLLCCLDLRSQQMSLTIREILFSGDANRLVAELTRVRVDDVAAPLEQQDIIVKVEPIFTLIILLNGMMVGLQTASDEGQLWFWGNVAFTTVFLMELVLRASRAGRDYVFGAERWWNLFDVVLFVVSVCDVFLDALSTSADLTPLNALRVTRLARVTRLFRIFRMRYMRELNLMVRGILGGIYTLFWAVIVLFFTHYVIAVAATFTIGRDPNMGTEVAEDELFASVPRSLLTSFRCSMGDCNTKMGLPIVPLLTDSYGTPFVVCYLASMIFVVFGLFNLIAAVYVENTMNAARADGEKSSSDRHRESIRIARLARQLVKKFCAAQKLEECHTSGEVKNALRTSAWDDLGEKFAISKEMFLCVIQDASVQKLMDELDIPPDRAGLFDILDATGSGGLEVSELITGLLRVRGEAKKRDVLGALLAVRAVQEMMHEQDARLRKLEKVLDHVHDHLICLPAHSEPKWRQGEAANSASQEADVVRHEAHLSDAGGTSRRLVARDGLEAANSSKKICGL